MSRRILRRTTLWLILGLVILSCGTPALVAPSPSVPEPGDAATEIVQTAGAAQTQTIQALPPTKTPSLTPLATKTPTDTPTPTATVLFLFPTATNLPDNFFDNSGGSSNITSTASGNNDGEEKLQRRQLWACRVISKSPADESVVIGGTSIKTIWTVENTGTETWPKKSVDIIYAGGARLNEGKPYYDIPKAVAPGGRVTISVTMNMPKRSKDYQTKWALKIGRTEFCFVKFIFSVK